MFEKLKEEKKRAKHEPRVTLINVTLRFLNNFPPTYVPVGVNTHRHESNKTLIVMAGVYTRFSSDKIRSNFERVVDACLDF